MRAPSSPYLVAVVVGGMLLSPIAASAQGRGTTASEDASRQEAKRLFNRGRIAFRAKRYEEAILRWQESYALSNEPLILWNIAKAFEALDQPAEALAYYEEWAPHASDDEKEELEAKITQLEAEVESLPPAPTDDANATEKPEVPKEKPEKGEASSPLQMAGWTMVGIGGAAIVTGIVLDVVATSSRPARDDFCRELDGDLLCSQDGRDDIHDTNALAIGGDATWIAGSAVAAVGLTMALLTMLTEPDETKTKDGMSLELHPSAALTPTGTWTFGVGIDGAF